MTLASGASVHWFLPHFEEELWNPVGRTHTVDPVLLRSFPITPSLGVWTTFRV